VALERTKARSEFGLALDLCTGSGCVAIAFKHQRPTWKVTASDVSESALSVARGNAERLGTAFGMRFVVSDLFANLPTTRYSLITANPPYIPDDLIPSLDPDIRDFEPGVALSGGADGLLVAERVVHDAPSWLEPNGILAIEIGYDQAPRTEALFTAAGFADVATQKDYGARDRVVSGRLPA
jgi:release factor glutamine methyltransferase